MQDVSGSINKYVGMSFKRNRLHTHVLHHMYVSIINGVPSNLRQKTVGKIITFFMDIEQLSCLR